METKLTLRLEEELIKGAEEYARSQHKSLSQIVAEFFTALNPKKAEKTGTKREGLAPVTSKLVGSLKGARLDEDFLA
jgi:predicted HicB family RNase H-like nuclease